MRHQKHRGLIFQGLDHINSLIQSLQQSIAEIEILKSGKFWREHGEKSAGFLKRTQVSRQNQRSIIELRDPVTEELCQEQHDISRIATKFYTSLFTPSPTDTVALRAMTRSIP
ncbi:hypothetical protein CU098_012627, partial [Rhizopus stolonifer]